MWKDRVSWLALAIGVVAVIVVGATVVHAQYGTSTYGADQYGIATYGRGFRPIVMHPQFLGFY